MSGLSRGLLGLLPDACLRTAEDVVDLGLSDVCSEPSCSHLAECRVVPNDEPDSEPGPPLSEVMTVVRN